MVISNELLLIVNFLVVLGIEDIVVDERVFVFLWFLV